MSHELYETVKIIAAVIGTIAVVGGGGVALGKWLFGKGSKEGSRDTGIDLAIARLNKVADKWESKYEEEHRKEVERARRDGERDAWERTIEAQVKELDETMTELILPRLSAVQNRGQNR